MKLRNHFFLFVFALFLSAQSMFASADDKAAIQELYQKIESMGREIDQLRGDNEKLNYELGQLKENQKKGFMSIDARLAEQKQSVANPAAPAQPVPVAKPVAVAPPAQAVAAAKPQTVPAVTPVQKSVVAKPAQSAATKPAGVNEKSAYNNAYQTLKGDRNAGIAAFTQFLKDYPDSPLAENAHYWIGEANYSQAKYQQAIDSFVVVLNKYKAGNKAPDAAVKLGYSFYELKDWTMARRTFNDVLRYFPQSNAAKLAEARLERMKKEGN